MKEIIDEVMTLEVKHINEEEFEIKERKFRIMKQLNVMDWQQAQALVIGYMMEKKNVH